MIKTGDVKIVKVPVEQFPKKGFSKVEEVLDRPIVSNILADEAVVEDRLAARNAGVGISPVIPEGMRAVSVRVTDDSAVSGFVLPGMRVDVLVTGRPPSGTDTITKTVLQNILVLSAGQTTQADSRGQAVNAPTVTLLVSPDDAEILTLAGSEGRIKLVLRNGADTKEASTTGTNMNRLYRGVRGKPMNLPGAGSSNPEEDAERPKVAVRRRTAVPPPVIAEPAVPRPPVQAPPDQIVMIRGEKRSVEVVRPHNTNDSTPPQPPSQQ
jgi:pilus assembly protein CpaB